MPIAIVCHCGKRFDVPDSYIGRKGNCTACGAPLAVPSPNGINVGASDEQLRNFGPTPSGMGLAAPPPPAGDAVRLTAPAPPAPAGVSAAAQQLTIGRKLAVYELERKLGDPRSTVFLAKSPRGPVAVKVLPHRIVSSSPTAGKRFLREARALFGLAHEHVVRCLDAGEELGTYWLSMEYVEGKTLAQTRLERGGKLTEREVIEYARQIALGLGHLAQSSLVHRNVKPEHVLIAPDGKVKLVGLGLIREAEGEGAALTMKGTIVGTPQYMSPEQARAEDLDVRADLWSLGVCVYELLAGELPWDDKVVPRVLQKLAMDPPPPLQHKNPSVSAATVAVVEKLLAKKKEDRYSGVEALCADLEAILSGQLVGVLPPGVASAGKPGANQPAPPTAPIKLAPGAAAPPASADQVKKLLIVVGVLALMVVALLIVVVILLVRGSG